MDENRSYYNREEVDALIATTKDRLITKINETFSVGTSDATPPKEAKSTLSIKVLRTEGGAEDNGGN